MSSIRWLVGAVIAVAVLLVGILLGRASVLWRPSGRPESYSSVTLALESRGVLLATIGVTFALSLAVCCLVIILAGRAPRMPAAIVLALSLVLGLTSAAVALDSMHVGEGRRTLSEVMTWNVKRAGEPPGIVSFWFTNGSSTPTDPMAVRRILGGLRSCGAAGIQVIGYASSAKYRERSDERNLGLAQRRADSVKRLALQEGLNPKSDSWTRIDDMRQLRFFADEAAGLRVLGVETLNRRVDIQYKCAEDHAPPSIVEGRDQTAPNAGLPGQ